VNKLSITIQLLISTILAVNPCQAGITCQTTNGVKTCEYRQVTFDFGKCRETKSLEDCEKELIEIMMEISRQKDDIVISEYFN
jgi:hypothetical protein